MIIFHDSLVENNIKFITNKITLTYISIYKPQTYLARFCELITYLIHDKKRIRTVFEDKPL